MMNADRKCGTVCLSTAPIASHLHRNKVTLTGRVLARSITGIARTQLEKSGRARAPVLRAVHWRFVLRALTKVRSDEIVCTYDGTSTLYTVHGRNRGTGRRMTRRAAHCRLWGRDHEPSCGAAGG